MIDPTPFALSSKQKIRKIRRFRNGHKLQYYCPFEKQVIYEQRIRLHHKCFIIQPLSEEEFGALKASVASEARPLLRERILIDNEGQILDGHHRAKALCELGHAEDLACQIAEKSGPWVTVTTSDMSANMIVATSLACRRHLQNKSIVALLGASRSAAILRDKSLDRHEKKAMLRAHLKRLGISQRLDQLARYIRKRATTLEFERLLRGELVFHSFLDELKQQQAHNERPRRDEEIGRDSDLKAKTKAKGSKTKSPPSPVEQIDHMHGKRQSAKPGIVSTSRIQSSLDELLTMTDTPTVVASLLRTQDENQLRRIWESLGEHLQAD